MEDKLFLKWLHQRLMYQYDADPQLDWMHKLRAIIRTIPDGQITPNLGTDWADMQPGRDV